MAKARGVLRDLLGEGNGNEDGDVKLACPIVEMHGERAQTFVIVRGDLHLHLGPAGMQADRSTEPDAPAG